LVKIPVSKLVQAPFSTYIAQGVFACWALLFSFLLLVWMFFSCLFVLLL
jgi:hypothetical protein